MLMYVPEVWLSVIELWTTGLSYPLYPLGATYLLTQDELKEKEKSLSSAAKVTVERVNTITAIMIEVFMIDSFCYLI